MQSFGNAHELFCPSVLFLVWGQALRKEGETPSFGRRSDILLCGAKLEFQEGRGRGREGEGEEEGEGEREEEGEDAVSHLSPQRRRH